MTFAQARSWLLACKATSKRRAAAIWQASVYARPFAYVERTTAPKLADEYARGVR